MTGALSAGVYAKDVILTIIQRLGVSGGVDYVNPDRTTFEYLSGRAFVPAGETFDRARAWWSSIASDADARYDDEVVIGAEALTPVVTWGVNPGQSVAVNGRIPSGRDGRASTPDSAGRINRRLVDDRRIELLTSTLRTRHSPSSSVQPGSPDPFFLK